MKQSARALEEPLLTSRYNSSPRWLAPAHDVVDVAAAAAYDWSADIFDEDALGQLLALNGGSVGHG